MLAGVAQKLGDGNFLGRAGAYIDHGLEVRVVDLGDHFARFRTGGDDVRLFFAQRLYAEIDAVLLGQLQAAFKGSAHAVPAILVIPTFLQVTLHGRADNHHLAAEVAAELD